MGSIEEELGLNETKSESSYFDYVEKKTTRGVLARTNVVDDKKPVARQAKITKNAKFWKEFSAE